jgi:hypothetical protein
MRTTAIALCFILFVMCFTTAETETKAGASVPRDNFGNRLELNDLVYSGAGQDPDSFKQYFNIMAENAKPAIYMFGIQLKEVTNGMEINNLKQELNYYKSKHNICLIPLISLAMSYGKAAGEGSSCYDEDVAEGLYDDKIDFLCRSLADLGCPFFLRIGIEFNGLSWYGYRPKPYVKAFKKITDAVRKYNLDAATVWSAAYNRSRSKGFYLDNEEYAYMEYYPGDDYVDWWGLSMFQPEVFNHPETDKFFANAKKHRKPVMISESTPIFTGTNDGRKDWDAWFKLYFDFIKSRSSVKAFCYINWDWAQASRKYSLPWSDWGDCRIEANNTVLSLYKEEMKNPLYFHGQDEKAFRKALGIQDTIPPTKAKNIIASFNNSAVDLTWQKADDDTMVLRYEVFKNDEMIGNAVQNSYRDRNIKAGSTITYAIRAVDRGGNKGELENSNKISIPDSMEKLRGGDFEYDNHEWIVRQFFGEKLIFSIETKNPLTGNGSAKLFVEKAAGTNWHLQFGYLIRSYKGLKYTLSFTIKADARAEIDIFLQQNHEPYSSLLFETIKADKNPRKYTFVNTSPAEDDSLFLTFMCGKANKRTIYIDDVSLIEAAEK